MRHVFLHAGWRTGSTYVWNRFRLLPQAGAFLEPFHEALARLDWATVNAMTATSWESGHPELDAPYFAEYLPLIADCGVTHFEEAFSYRQFAAGPDDAQRRYLATLVDFADAEGRAAVLGFCRSTARVAAIRGYFPDGVHVFQKRSAEGQFSSCWNQFTRRSNPYFLAVHYLIAAAAPPESPFATLRGALDIPDLHGMGFEEQYQACVDLTSQRGEQQAFRIFGHVYEYCRLHSEQHCDVVLDLDTLVLDADYRHSAEEQLHQLSGLRVTFDDTRRPQPEAPFEIDLSGLMKEATAWAREHVPDL